MKVTNYGTDGLPLALGGWSSGVTAISSNATVMGGLTAQNFVQLVTSNSSNSLLRPIANFAAGSNISLAAASNTITITAFGVAGAQGPPGAGGITSGSSMPAQPAYGNNVPFYRTDLALIFYYDGTRWLCTCPHDMAEGPQTQLVPISVVTSAYLPVPALLTTSIYLTSLNVGCYVVTTNSASHYWILTVSQPSWTSAVVNTSASAADTQIILRYTTPFAWSFSTHGWMEVQMTKNGTPGTMYHMISYSFRYIGT